MSEPEVEEQLSRSTMLSSNTIAPIPSGNGKTQPWKAVYPPIKENLIGVVEAKGQMLLLDGTGGSGTVAVPNTVVLPPKPKPKPKEEEDEAKS